MENESAGKRFMAEFVVEAMEHIDLAETALLGGEAAGLDSAAQAEFMRAMHTIKGAAGYLALGPVQTLAHALEHAVQTLAGTPNTDPERLAVLFDGLDALRRLVARPQNAQEAPAALLEALETGHTMTGAASDSDSVLREAFANVVRQQCDALRAALERFEQDPEDTTARDSYAGVLSTLQAAAAYAGRRDLQEIVAEAGRSPNCGVGPAAALLERLVAILAQDSPVPAGSALPEPGARCGTPLVVTEPVASRFVRISAERIDKLVEQAGELAAMRNTLQRFIYSLECADLGDNVRAGGRALALSLGHMVDELQRSALDLRLIQLGAVLQRLPRVARDVAARTKKRVRVEMEGADTEIDKGMAEAIADPLLHMVRNAVDHGLEAPDERVSAGKDPEGLVLIRASRQGNFVVVSVEDDGRGIDPESVRQAATAKGILSPEEADSLSVAGAYGLLFRPGFSTARTLTEISGRGVGLDVVRANVNRLGGEVMVASQLGSFTRVEMRLPACVSAQDVLLVQAAGDWYAIPLDAVRMSLSVPAHNVRRAGGHTLVVSNGELVSIQSLSALLGLHEATDDGTTCQIVVLALPGSARGLVVDVIGQRQQVTIRPLDVFLASDGITGAAVLADGRVVLVLDPEPLVSSAGAAVRGSGV